MSGAEARPIRLAGAVIQDGEGKILLLHRYRDGRDQWETPGGRIESAESPSEAAVREVAEELGLAVDAARHIGGATFLEDARVYDYVWFEATPRDDRAPQLCEPDTFDGLEYFSLDQLRALLRKGRLSPNAANLVGQLIAGTVALQASAS